MTNPESSLPCPYKGLNPFEQNDEAFFFGRNNDQKIVISSLYGSSLTVLYGASGVGKTSLLRAGVVPELKRSHNVAAVIFRQWQGDDFRDLLRAEILKETLAAVNRWFEAHEKTERLKDVELVSAINQKLEREHAKRLEAPKRRLTTTNSKERTASQVSAAYQSDPPRLEGLSLDRFMIECAKSFEGRIFFIIDQFEEYFLYHHETGEAAEDFDSQFALAVNSPEIPVSFLVSLRDDGLSKLDRLKDRIPNLFGNIIRLKHLDRDEATDAIKKPLEELNKQNNLEISIEDDLVRELLEVKPGSLLEQKRSRQAGNQTPLSTGQSQVDMPSLQIVLTRLWEADIEKGSKRSLTKATFDDQGGAVGIVQKYLENRMDNGLSDQLRTPEISEEALIAEAKQTRSEAAQIFRYLVTAVGSKYAPTVSDLVDWTKISQDRVVKTLEVLCTLSVVRRVGSELSEDEPEKRRYEIFHDFLAGAVSQWREEYEKKEAEEKARAAAEEEAKAAADKAKADAEQKVKVEAAKAKAEVEKARAEAEEDARVQAEKAKNLWWTTVGILTVLVAILIAIISLQATWTADEQRKLADEQRKLADEQRKLADEQRKLAEKGRELALVEGDGLRNLRLADNALLFSKTPDQACYALPAVVEDIELVKKISKEHNRAFQVPIRALLVLHSVIPPLGSGNAQNPVPPSDSNPEDVIPAMFSPDGKIYVTIDDGNQPIVWNEKFVKQYSLGYAPDLKDLKITKIGFSKDSNRFAVEGLRKNDNKDVVAAWDLCPPENPCDPPINRKENVEIDAVLGLDKEVESTGIYVKKCPVSEKGGVFESYEAKTREWLSAALPNVKPLADFEKRALPFAVFGIGPNQIDELPTERIVRACELTFKDRDQAKTALKSVMAELSLPIEDLEHFLIETDRKIAETYLGYGDTVALPEPNKVADKVAALAFYTKALEIYPASMASTPENRFKAISLVIEGNKQRKSGDRKAAKDSYSEAQKLAPDYFPPGFDPEKEAARPDPDQSRGAEPSSKSPMPDLSHSNRTYAPHRFHTCIN
jgi:hypothetical protein